VWREAQLAPPVGEQETNTEMRAGGRKARSPAQLEPSSSSTTVHRQSPPPRLIARLQVEQLSSEDNGLYRCRVDFRRARSRIEELEVQVIGECLGSCLGLMFGLRLC